MIDIINQVTSVAASTLKNRIYNDNIIDERSFYTITKENGLIPLVYEGLDLSKVSITLKNKLSKHYFNFIAHDLQMLEAIKRIKELLNKNKIKHIFLKGSLLKFIYPKSYYRGMGDIDILIDEKDLDYIHEIFKLNNIELLHKSSSHDVFKIYENITIEVHPKLYNDFNKKYAFIIEHPWDYAILDSEYTYKFTHEFTIVYLLYHLAKHLDSSGIGLRSTLDIGIYVNHYKDEINKENLKYLLDRTSLTTFFSNLIYINKIYFQIENISNFIYSPLLQEYYYNEIIIYFSTSGIHGKGSNHNQFENKIVSNSNKKKSRFRLLLKILFPKLNVMKESYSVLKKASLLLPLFWVIRWLKLIFKKTKSTLKKITLLLFKTNKNSINKIKSIHDKLGL